MMRTVWWIFGTLVTLAVVSWLGWLLVLRISDALADPEESRRDQTTAVEVAAVQTGLIRDVRRFTGTLRARSRVEIAPRIGGQLEKLHVDIGDVIERGQVIALLDDEEFEQEVQQSRADLLVAQATLEEKKNSFEIAEREYQRTQRLREQRIASESELDVARSQFQAEQAAVKVAEAEVSRREAALRAAQVRLSYTVIRANWDTGGETRVVGERFVDEGGTVAANTPLVSLLDLDPLIAVVYVTERDYVPLRIGLTATITADTNPGKAHSGRIVRMAPAFQEGSRQARIEIEVPNPDHAFKPGMFVRTHLELGQDENATIIPRQALLTRDGREGVFVVHREENTVRFVLVQLGIRDGTRVQVIDGDLDGPVVVLGHHLLSNGMAVTIAGEEDAETDDAVELADRERAR